VSRRDPVKFPEPGTFFANVPSICPAEPGDTFSIYLDRLATKRGYQYPRGGAKSIPAVRSWEADVEIVDREPGEDDDVE